MSSWSRSTWSQWCVSDVCDGTLLTKLSSSGSSLKKGLCSRSCWCTKFSMSTSKLADVMHSDPCVACSHFSNNKASRGNNGCLRRQRERSTVCVRLNTCFLLFDFGNVGASSQNWSSVNTHFTGFLSSIRRFLELDIWTKKGLTASYHAISACYFCTKENKGKHILLRLDQISHPHTAECMKTCADWCTQDWGIPTNKILTVITDNGSNMVAAFKNNDEPTQSSSSEEEESQESDENSDVVEHQS